MSRTDRDLFDSFLDSILQLKKGLPRPPASFLREGEKTTYYKLTTYVEPIEYNLTTNQDELYDEIVATVHEIFNHTKFNPENEHDLVRSFFPSTSATYYNARNEMGALGDIITDRELMTYVQTNDKLINENHLFMDDSLGRSQEVMSIDAGPLVQQFQSLYGALLHDAIDEESVAIPLGLSEPLKVRVITKGPPRLYTVLKPLQRFLWGRLQKFPCFQLTGTPVTEDIINEVFPLEDRPELEFLSIDYSDATNDLHSWCSELVLNTLYKMGVIDLTFFKLSLKAMTQHSIHYDVSGEGLVLRDGEYIVDCDNLRPGMVRVGCKQKRGQLMGSVLSFPILCIINASVCRLASRLDGNTVTLQRGLLVNGDDGLFKGSSQIFDIWSDVAQLAGWKPSIGKVYQSREFFNINSRSFTVRGDRRYVTPYVNMGILTGKKRSENLSLSKEGGYKLIGALARELIRESPDSIHELVLGQFIYRHWNFLKSLSIPWFLPEYVGGLGLPEVGEVFRTCSYDRFRAGLIYDSFLDQVPHFSTSAWRVFDYARLKTNRHIELLGMPEVKSKTDLVDQSKFYTLGDYRSLYAIESMLTNRLRYRTNDDDPSFVFKLFNPLSVDQIKNKEAAYLKKLRAFWKFEPEFQSRYNFDPVSCPAPVPLNKKVIFPRTDLGPLNAFKHLSRVNREVDNIDDLLFF